MRISNNVPCPCHSGKKYKKCCMGKLSPEKEQYYALLMFEKKLKDKLVNIVLADFGKEMLEEYSLQFNDKHFRDMEGGFDFLHFFEWFFLEAKDENGEKFLNLIIENFPNQLNDDERSIINEWLTNTQAGIFETIKIDEKEWFVQIKDIFSNKEYAVRDRIASMQLIKADIFYGRVQKILGNYYLAGVAQRYPRLILGQLRDYIDFYYEKARDETGQSYEDFMNTHGDLIIKFEPKQPKFISSSGDELKLCEQIYLILDKKQEAIMDWINKNNDLFIITDVNIKDKKFSASVTIKAKENDIWNEKNERSMKVTSHFIHQETGERILSAGSITIKGNKMKVFCSSERVLYDIIKKMLGEQGIGDFVKLIREDIELPSDILSKKNSSKNKDRIKKEVRLEVIGQGFLIDYCRKWCDMKIPALDNKTPREAIKTEEGKEKLKELLKDFENIDLHKKREGELFVDSVRIIRDELNFYE